MLVQEKSSQGFAEKGPQLKDVPYLDASDGLQACRAMWAPVPGLSQSDVGETIHLEVSWIVGISEMGIWLIGAHHEVAATGDGGVSDSLEVLDADGRSGACHQAGLGYLLVGCQP